MPLTIKVFIQSPPSIDEDFVVTEEKTLSRKAYKVDIEREEFRKLYKTFVALKDNNLEEDWDMLLMGISKFHIYTYDNSDCSEFIEFVETYL